MYPNQRKNLDYIPLATADDIVWSSGLKRKSQKKLWAEFMRSVDDGNLWRVALLLELRCEKKQWFKKPKVIQAVEVGAEYNAALFCAITNNDVKMARLLLDYGARPNHGSECKPLDRAVYSATERMFELLFDYGADIRLANQGILENMIKEQPAECLELILKAGTRRHILDPSILSHCLWHDQPKKLALLLKYGADANTSNGLLLMGAVEMGSLSYVKLLIEHGADVGIKKNLALLKAVKKKDTALVKYLIEQGANPCEQHKEIAKYIKKYHLTEIANILEYKGLISQKETYNRFLADCAGIDAVWHKKSDHSIEKSQNSPSRGVTLTHLFNFKSQKIQISATTGGLKNKALLSEEFQNFNDKKSLFGAYIELKKRGGSPNHPF